MRLFRPRVKITNAAPKEVAFYFAQYMELMKHGEDETDFKLKDYIYSVILNLGVPDRTMFIEVEQDVFEEPKQIEVLSPEPEHLPVIHRRKSGYALSSYSN